MSRDSLFLGDYAPIPTPAEIVDDLREQAYAPLPFALGKAACDELFTDFRSFVEMCTEPGGEQLVDALTFDVNGIGNGVYYLQHRRPGEVNPHEQGRAPGKDHKYTFHFGSQTIARATAELGVLPEQMAEFLDKCREFYGEMVKTAKIGAAALGLEHTMFNPDEMEDVHHLRLLDYVASLEPYLGEPHFDRGLATLAVTETRSGLRGVAGQNGKLVPVTVADIEALRANLRPIDHHEHEAKFFLGAGANHLPEHKRVRIAEIPLLGHDISNDFPGESRQSAVGFLNPHQKFAGFTVPQSHETGFDDIIKSIRAAA